MSSDIDGRLAITGTFSGNISLGGHSISSIGHKDAFIAKIASTGTVLWANSLGGEPMKPQNQFLSTVLAIFGLLEIRICANFSASTNNLDLSGDAGGYLAPYDEQGDNLWAIDPIGSLSVRDDANGAWFLDRNGSNDVIKFVDNSGSIQANFLITGATVGISELRSKNLIATSDGNALICLNSPNGTLEINGESVTNLIDNQSALVKLKTNGQVAWSLPITNSNNFLWSLDRGTDDFVWALGSVSSGSADSTLSLGEYSVSLSASTGILLKIDPSGEVAGLWSSTPASEVLVDPNDNIWITGTYQGEAGQNHTLSIGQLSLNGDAANSRFVGRIGKLAQTTTMFNWIPVLLSLILTLETLSRSSKPVPPCALVDRMRMPLAL